MRAEYDTVPLSKQDVDRGDIAEATYHGDQVGIFAQNMSEYLIYYSKDAAYAFSQTPPRRITAIWLPRFKVDNVIPL